MVGSVCRSSAPTKPTIGQTSVAYVSPWAGRRCLLKQCVTKASRDLWWEVPPEATHRQSPPYAIRISAHYQEHALAATRHAHLTRVSPLADYWACQFGASNPKYWLGHGSNPSIEMQAQQRCTRQIRNCSLSHAPLDIHTDTHVTQHISTDY